MIMMRQTPNANTYVNVCERPFVLSKFFENKVKIGNKKFKMYIQ